MGKVILQRKSGKGFKIPGKVIQWQFQSWKWGWKERERKVFSPSLMFDEKKKTNLARFLTFLPSNTLAGLWSCTVIPCRVEEGGKGIKNDEITFIMKLFPARLTQTADRTFYEQEKNLAQTYLLLWLWQCNGVTAMFTS